MILEEIISSMKELQFQKNQELQILELGGYEGWAADYINCNEFNNSFIDVIDSNQNLYDLISNSKLVIGFPFTSPVVIGQELDRPSIFYCSSKLLPIAHKGRKLSFIQSQTSLYSYMEKILVKSI